MEEVKDALGYTLGVIAVVGIDVAMLALIMYIGLSDKWYNASRRYRSVKMFVRAVNAKMYTVSTIGEGGATVDSFYDRNSRIIDDIFVTHFIDRNLDEMIEEIRKHCFILAMVVLGYAASKITPPPINLRVRSLGDFASLFFSWQLSISIAIDLLVIAWLYAGFSGILKVVPVSRPFKIVVDAAEQT